MKHPRAAGVVVAAAVGVTLATFTGAAGQQLHRNAFETRETSWARGVTDATFRETAHEMTDATAHTGQLCERLQITAEGGNYIHYYYPTARAPVTDDLTARVWVKANRPGVQLLARLVLPRMRDPKNLDQPLTTLLRGDLYQTVGRWQPLTLRNAVKLAKEQQQLLRAELGRDVDLTDAYVDRLILNAYGGIGVTDLYLDDLEIGPVLDNAPAPAAPAAPAPGAAPVKAPRAQAAVVELNQDQLLVNNRRFFFRGIRHSDTPLKALRDAGFNTVWFDYATPPATLDEAIRLGFWIVPSLPVASPDDTRLTSGPGDRLRQEIYRFADKDAVLFWELGGGLTDEQGQLVARSAQAVRDADRLRPLGADVWDGYQRHGRHLGLVGIHRWPLLTGMELPQYREWLLQRRNLTGPATFTWTWIQTHLPEWYTALVYDQPAGEPFNEPVGPQPEQIRLLTWLAVSAGYRGLGFWSDRFLADSHTGRDRLLTLALLNQELKMLEPMLVTLAAAPRQEDWIPTSHGEVRAAVLRTQRGVLVLPMWVGAGAQFVPGQAAAANLTMTVPQVPDGTQAWLVTPAEVRSLPVRRLHYGTEVTLPEFGLTAAVVFTSDNGPNGLVVAFQNQAREARELAAQWAFDLAREEYEKVVKVQAELERLGKSVPEARKLLEDARTRLQYAADYRGAQDFRQAYNEAERSLRPLRILMRNSWEKAQEGLTDPVSSPYGGGFYTLPRHYRFRAEIDQARAGENLLPNGDFELDPDQVPENWLLQESTLPQDARLVELSARRVTGEARQGRQCLVLEVKPRDPKQVPAALERTYLAINSPAVRLPPGTLVRVSGWVRVPRPIGASADGVLVYDSAGGEPLAVRLPRATVRDKDPEKDPAKGWKRFELYRRVPASGQVHVTVALTGLGTAYFDDLQIQPLVGEAARR